MNKIEFTVEDIHHFSKRLDSAIRKINESDKINQKNKEDILDFKDFCVAESLSIGRVYKYVWMMEIFAEQLGRKTFKQVKSQDLIKIVEKLRVIRKYEKSTMDELKITFRKFYRYLYKLPRNQDPEQTAWIELKKSSRDEKIFDILTVEEIKKMTQAAGNDRDRCLLLLTYEVGARVSEILTAQIKNIEFDNYGGKLTINQSKTQPRIVRFVLAENEVKNWLNKHPFSQDVNAPLFCSLGDRNRYAPLSYNAFAKVLKELAKRAKITKHVSPQTLRRSRATHLAPELKEHLLKVFFGWSTNSRVASRYVRLNGQDLDDKVLEMYDKKVPKTLKSKFSFQTCSKCNTKNKFSNKYCENCGNTLDQERALDMEIRERLFSEIGKAVIVETNQNPDFQGALGKISEKIQMKKMMLQIIGEENLEGYGIKVSEAEKRKIFGERQNIEGK